MLPIYLLVSETERSGGLRIELRIEVRRWIEIEVRRWIGSIGEKIGITTNSVCSRRRLHLTTPHPDSKRRGKKTKNKNI
jgi:hypothetical protein